MVPIVNLLCEGSSLFVSVSPQQLFSVWTNKFFIFLFFYFFIFVLFYFILFFFIFYFYFFSFKKEINIIIIFLKKQNRIGMTPVHYAILSPLNNSPDSVGFLCMKKLFSFIMDYHVLFFLFLSFFFSFFSFFFFFLFLFPFFLSLSLSFSNLFIF